MSYYGNQHQANMSYYGGMPPQSHRPLMLHELPPPPPPPDMPPLPLGPPPPSDTYRFQGDSWRPNGAEQNTYPQNEFAFRNDRNAPQYPRDADYYPRPTRSKNYARNEQKQSQSQGMRYPGQDGHKGGRDERRGYGSFRGRGNRAKPATADRPLLRFQRGSTPEQLAGMVEDPNGAKRFLPAEDISDSEEEDMDQSESDQDQQTPMDGLTARVSAEAADVDAESMEPPTKKQAREPTTEAQTGGASVPRWSNPDPYTVLPPTDETQRKKKDVVKLIRKARIVLENVANTNSQVATNDDFISFGFGDDLNQEQDTDGVTDDEQEPGKGVPGAPSGPRQFSHLQNLHGQTTINAPGTNGPVLSANSLGPPPGRDGSSQDQAQHVLRDEWPPRDVNAALGTRKRTHDDVIKNEPPRPPKRGFKDILALNGKVIREWTWRPESVTSATPWLVQDHRNTENQGFRLHKEICDFYDFVKPKAFEQAVREELLERLRKIVKRRFPNSDVRCFGSFAAGLYLPNADIDVVVVSDGYLNHGVPTVCQTKSKMYNFAYHLEGIGIAEHGSIEIIPRAKVPLIKFVDRITSLRVDVSFENNTGLIANNTFDGWKQEFPAMPILVTVVKQFLMMRGLNEVVNGGLGGFSVTCLVTSLLQNMPRVQTGEIVPEHHLGEVLMEFLDFYGNQLDVARTGIVMNPPAYFNKFRSSSSTYQAYKSDRLAIMDPNRPDNDISGGSGNVLLIFKRFARAHREMLEAMSDTKRISLLDWMLGGKYDSFIWQRNRLEELYRAKWGKPESESPNPLMANHQLTDQHLHLNGIHDPGSPGHSIASGVEGRSVLNRKGVPANPFGQPPQKKKAAKAAKAGPTPDPNRPIVKPKAKNQPVQQNKQEPKGVTAAAMQKSKPPRPTTKAAARSAKSRADGLRRDYPDIKGVPAKVSKSQRAKYVADYIAKHGDPKKKPVEPSAKNKMPARRSKRLAASPSKATATPTDGASNKNPITID